MTTSAVMQLDVAVGAQQLEPFRVTFDLGELDAARLGELAFRFAPVDVVKVEGRGILASEEYADGQEERGNDGVTWL
ncbi:MAG: hypothetical protein M3R38_37115 [Actinomycetota bacterium]|nr:hypothetical protein [Actinomycetota bacterium]